MTHTFATSWVSDTSDDIVCSSCASSSTPHTLVGYQTLLTTLPAVLTYLLLWRTLLTPVPKIIDPFFAKTSQNARFLLSENERFGLVFVKTGSMNSGTVKNKTLMTTLPAVLAHAVFYSTHFLPQLGSRQQNWRKCDKLYGPLLLSITVWYISYNRYKYTVYKYLFI
jgi:hypothetical protein